jgi:hypothetical protein
VGDRALGWADRSIPHRAQPRRVCLLTTWPSWAVPFEVVDAGRLKANVMIGARGRGYSRRQGGK